MLARMDENTRQERSRALGATLPADPAPAAGSDPDAARLHTLLEVAFLAAAADGVLADAEIHNLAANLQDWLQAELEPEFLIKLFDHLATQLAAEGAPARLAAAAATLDPESRRYAYKLACITTLCDNEVHDDELGFLGTIADAFAIPGEEAQATFDQLDEVITSLGAA